MKELPSTLVLTRIQFHEDCTVGRLSDSKGQLLCMTLEPRWRAPLQEHVTVKGPCCVPPGVYPLHYGYDHKLKYLCWHVGGHHGPAYVRLCFLTKSGSVAAHIQTDILLGYLCPEGDGEQPFDGRLYRPVEAYERLRDYYTSLRANHGDFLLRVEPTKGPVKLLPAVEAPKLLPDLVKVEDYILQTL